MISSGKQSGAVGGHLHYALLSLAYVAGIYWLSSLAELGFQVGDPWVRLASKLFHISLYAGLAFCVLQAVSGGWGRQPLPWKLSGLIFLGTGALAAFDEWHQAFVPGRSASVSDFLSDLVGIAGMLLLLRLGALRRMGP